jgi:3'(2'), 5'-bisphosphate nucleotidase
MISPLIAALESVGRLLMALRGAGGEQGQWHGTQFKAEADLRAHERMVQELSRLAPGVPVVSEEDVHDSPPRPEAYFLIDPVDGTASYAGGFDGFVTQAALIEGGRPVLAVVHAPAHGSTWWAERGTGAFLGTRRLQLAPTNGRLLVIDNYPEPKGIARELVRALPATGYVECGSISLKACRVVEGSADVFVKDVVVRDWDVAPADLLFAEAGGQLTDVDGLPYRYGSPSARRGVIAVSDPRLAGRVLSILVEPGMGLKPNEST